jgi:spore coat protein A
MESFKGKIFTRRGFVRASAMGAAGIFVLKAGLRQAYAFGNSPTSIRKFVKRLPSLGLNPLPANEDGMYVPVAQPASRIVNVPRGPAYKVDYYRIQIAPYTQTIYTDPGKSKFEISPRFLGYQDVTNGKVADPKYLGGVIIAKSGNPVQITFENNMPKNHILPVDKTVPGAAGDAYGRPNRAAVHFHGGEVPWISDGGPFDWFSADGRLGSSFANNSIPGASAGIGEAEYYYPMDQSARFCWYHDHAFGLTRINAYAGMASALLIVDSTEEALINSSVLPSLPGYLRYGIPLVLQDKTFWDPKNDDDYPVLGATKGDLWYPWQYETARWGTPFDNPPSVLNIPVSTVPEFFADTMLVNGCPYPYLPVEPRHYRFRILNGSQGRFYNLQLYYVKSGDSGDADLTKAGPRIIQIGTEGGFLRAPVALNNPPVQIGFDVSGTADTNPTYGNAVRYNLLMAPGERTDVIIDFSKCQVGSKIVHYNDAPAPFPGGDTLNDYFTGGTIGSLDKKTAPGFGPNTQTIMQFQVSPFNTLGQGTLPDPPMMNLLELLATGKTSLPNPLPSIQQFTQQGLRKLGVKERWLSLNEDFDEYGRLMQRLGTLNSVHPARDPASQTGTWLGESLDAAPTEVVNEGDFEVWHIVNTTADTHPMHFHLVNVQVLQRQAFDIMNFVPGTSPSLMGTPRPADANENGWKETVRMNPGEVTSVIMQFNLPRVPFNVDPSPRLKSFGIKNGAEYVWHCHILEHEEHDMMRPLVVIPKK